MPRSILAPTLAILLTLALPSAAAAGCAPGRVEAGGDGLWMEVAGVGRLTVVFEAGGGETSTAWAGIEPTVRALGVRTLTYDRAGLGRSEPATGPYRVEAETEALQRVLTACGIEGPVILVAHSYGGFIALLTAVEDRRIAGLVLVDAVLPEYFDEATLAALLAEYRPQYDALRQAAPALAAVMIPIVEAYPATVDRVGSARLPDGLPVIDIVAGDPMPDTGEGDAAWRRAHAAFVAAGPNREAVVAEGSGHPVNRDRPDVIVAAVSRLVDRLRD